MEQDKRKAERMNGYIRNLKVRLQGRELVTQSNFFNRKTPDLDGVLTLTKFGFSTIKTNNARSPGIKRNLNVNSNNLPKRHSENNNKMSPNYQRFQNNNYYYVRNNG